MHLQPEPTKRVVGKKLHDITWREELVTHGKLAAVARSVRSALIRVTHRLALFLRIEELVDPADRLVLAPYPAQIGSIKDRQQRFEGLPLRPKNRSSVASVE